MPLTLNDIITEVRELLCEPAPVFFSDAGITNWIKQATIDISTKTGCYESIVTLTLVAAQMEISKPTGCIKIYGIMHNGKGIGRIHPRMTGHNESTATGSPLRYYDFSDKIGLYPVPDAGAAALSTKGYITLETDDVTLIPAAYQPLAILYALSKAKLKEQKYAASAQLMAIYQNSALFQRQDLQERNLDSKDMFQLPDRSVTAK